MDWPTILTSLTGSTIIAAAIGYVIKRGFDRALDLRFERLKEENKAVINEETRRQGALFDELFPALKVSLSIVYRLRNTARDTIAAIEKNDWREARKLSNNLGPTLQAARETLFDQRATLPQSLFRCLHEMNSEVASLRNECELLFRNPQARKQTRIDDLKDSYNGIDHLYLLFAEQVQGFLGVSDENSPRLIEEGTDRASLLP